MPSDGGQVDATKKLRPKTPHVRPDPVAMDGTRPRYVELDVLGRGGMGDVVALEDEHLGRVVALKILREEESESPEAVHRFLREARVQGQLEHPAIVPVYDLWVDPVPRFTMKRVRGKTLAEVIAGQREGEVGFSRFTQHRLLTALGQVCLALDLAHESGVIHRDVKPGNIMLGDYGEVYLLDWGVSRVDGTGDDTPAVTKRALAKDPDLTSPGDVLGTLGYVAPEQLLGHGIDRRNDVFALGSILFEILTHEKLFAGDHAERVQRTIEGVDVDEAARSKNIAPELLDIVRRATAKSPDERYATAREMNEALEAYLDGERDQARRRQASRDHTEEAKKIFDRASVIGETRARDEAMLELGRALALDPDNREAMETIVRILRTRPASIPAEVRDFVDKRWMQTSKQVVPGLLGVHVGVMLLIPLILMMGLKSVPLMISMVAMNGAVIATEAWSRRAENGARATDIVFLASVAWSASLCLMFGPFVIVPAVAAVNTMAYMLVRRSVSGWLAGAIAASAFVVPAALQAIGILPPSYLFEGDAIRILPALHTFPAGTTHLFLLLASLAGVVLPTMILSRYRRALSSAETQLQFQAWQLSRLLPEQRDELSRG